MGVYADAMLEEGSALVFITDSRAIGKEKGETGGPLRASCVLTETRGMSSQVGPRITEERVLREGERERERPLGRGDGSEGAWMRAVRSIGYALKEVTRYGGRKTISRAGNNAVKRTGLFS